MKASLKCCDIKVYSVEKFMTPLTEAESSKKSRSYVYDGFLRPLEFYSCDLKHLSCSMVGFVYEAKKNCKL